MAVDVEEVVAPVCALQAAAADLAELPWDEISVNVADAVIAGVESVQRTLSMVG